MNSFIHSFISLPNKYSYRKDWPYIVLVISLAVLIILGVVGWVYKRPLAYNLTVSFRALR